jgi:two-component system CheB/CheR fusion protein
LTPKNPRGLTLPIDIFFTSLAEVYGRHAVGVILSGTGTDGTRGAVAINAAGGFLMAQEPESSKFDGMPRSVIATSLVDAILPAEELPVRLLAHIHNLPFAEPHLPQVVPHASMSDEDVVAAILQLLYQIGGIDFQDYKPATIMRRLERRMQVRHTPELHRYFDLLEHDRTEVIILRRELLISVTSFFRDPETFNTLFEKVILPMVAEKQAGETVRVWTAGTATGEEAYTIGMLFIEAFERERRWPNLKIFATDVDQQCVENAGLGQYPESAAAEISPERLERFFTKKGDRFIVKSDLRQSIVFARHNLLSDPPFTKMDLVICRNTLIYFKSAAQERALRSLQYAINQGGALLLGSSESLSAVTEGLQTISAKHKIFRRSGSMALPFFDRHGRHAYPQQSPGKGRASVKAQRTPSNEPNISDLGIATLLGKFAPPALIVNQAHEAVHLFGEVSNYLQQREGAASLELNRILPERLVPVASALLHKATRDQCSLVSDPVEVSLQDGQRQFLRLSAHPLNMTAELQERMSLLCFQVEAARPEPGETTSINVGAETIERLGVLERELAATRESLQATIEELETSNEELQATNEEMMAANEELQSSNEELQSVNEEMNTVNAEFQEKMHILNRVNADLDSMAKAAAVATIFVDPALIITRFSPDATQIFKLRDSDVGRRLDDIAHVLNYSGLIEDIELTLKSERMIEREVTTADGKTTFLVRILPYLVPSTTVRGAVATFVDVTAFRDAQRLQSIVDALPEHVAVVNTTGIICMVNAAWHRFARANGDPELKYSGVGANYLNACMAGGHEDDVVASAAARGLRGVLEGSLPLFSMEYPCHSPTEQRWFMMSVAPVLGQDGGAVVSHVNISNWYGKVLS